MNPHTPTVLHINTDDFFASVLRVKDPALRRRPVVVGHLASRGGVVSASYEARADGIRPGMTMAQARRACPGASLVHIDWDLYTRASSDLFGVLERFSPLVERASLDEGFLDYTGCRLLFGCPVDAAARIKREVCEATGLGVSVGLAANKLVSKVASGTAKCARLVDVFNGYEQSFLAPLAIGRLPGVGPKLGAALRDMAVLRIGDVIRFPEELLQSVFGPTAGRTLHRRARGVDRTPVRPVPAARLNWREEETLNPDSVDRRRLTAVLHQLAGRLGTRLRREKLAARRFTVFAQYSDQVRAQRTGFAPEPADLDGRITELALEAFHGLFTRRVRVRRLALGASCLEGNWQLPLFAGGYASRAEAARAAPSTTHSSAMRRLYEAVDGLRGKHGDDAVQVGIPVSASPDMAA